MNTGQASPEVENMTKTKQKVSITEKSAEWKEKNRIRKLALKVLEDVDKQTRRADSIAEMRQIRRDFPTIVNNICGYQTEDALAVLDYIENNERFKAKFDNTLYSELMAGGCD